MLTRLLIAGGGGGGSFPPSPVVSLTAPPEGGWNQKPRSRAVWYGDHTYIGYVTGDDGDMCVLSVPDGSSGTTHLLHAAFEVDTHASPALIVRDSDHKLLVLYSKHSDTTMYKRLSTNSLDSDPTLSGGFAAEATAFTGTLVTYPMVIQRTAEALAPLYCFYRERGTGTGVLAYRKSSDQGATWDSQHSVYADSGNITYWDIALAPDGMRIDFVVTDTDGASDQLGSLFHFFADDEDYKTSDGTPIAGGPPFDGSDLTLVYDEADAGKAWSHDLYVNGDGNPVFVYGIADTWTPPGGTDTEYRLAYWDGAAWQGSTILAAAGAGQFEPTLATLDPVDETVVYVTRKIAGQFELWRYTTADGGATWDAGEAVTSGSTFDNLYPVTVKDHPVDGLRLLWLAGKYTSATDNAVGITGLR